MDACAPRHNAPKVVLHPLKYKCRRRGPLPFPSLLPTTTPHPCWGLGTLESTLRVLFPGKPQKTKLPHVFCIVFFFFSQKMHKFLGQVHWVLSNLLLVSVWATLALLVATAGRPSPCSHPQGSQRSEAWPARATEVQNANTQKTDRGKVSEKNKFDEPTYDERGRTPKPRRRLHPQGVCQVDRRRRLLLVIMNTGQVKHLDM